MCLSVQGRISNGKEATQGKTHPIELKTLWILRKKYGYYFTIFFLGKHAFVVSLQERQSNAHFCGGKFFFPAWPCGYGTCCILKQSPIPKHK